MRALEPGKRGFAAIGRKEAQRRPAHALPSFTAYVNKVSHLRKAFPSLRDVRQDLEIPPATVFQALFSAHQRSDHRKSLSAWQTRTRDPQSIGVDRHARPPQVFSLRLVWQLGHSRGE